MDPAETLNRPQTTATTPDDAGVAPARPGSESVFRALRRWRPHAIVALVVGVALVVSEETRLLVLLIGFAAVVAVLAGPWGLRFWRLAQPSLFVEAAEGGAPAAPADPAPRDEPRPWPKQTPEHEPIAAD